MTTKTQDRLFPLALDESKLGSNQRAVLAWIDRWGSVSARVAGRVVYRTRGQDPERIDKDWLRAEGLRVLISLRDRGLVTSGRGRLASWRRRKRQVAV